MLCPSVGTASGKLADKVSATDQTAKVKTTQLGTGRNRRLLKATRFWQITNGGQRCCNGAAWRVHQELIGWMECGSQAGISMEAILYLETGEQKLVNRSLSVKGIRCDAVMDVFIKVLAVVGEGIGNASAGDKHILIQRALQNTGPPSFHGKKKKKATTCLHGQTAGPGWLGGGAGKCRLWNETETRGMDASGRMGQPNAPFRSMQLAGLAFLPA
ncbi:hypothetical protein DFJ77DRAFT_438392 [Powellomyces hirtus]|nr:hypothetical protein DFJ77DRAFT_438392 [Powellomyces hirtus]